MRFVRNRFRGRGGMRSQIKHHQRSGASRFFNGIDHAFGGWLPGGETPGEAQLINQHGGYDAFHPDMASRQLGIQAIRGPSAGRGSMPGIFAGNSGSSWEDEDGDGDTDLEDLKELIRKVGNEKSLGTPNSRYAPGQLIEYPILFHIVGRNPANGTGVDYKNEFQMGITLACASDTEVSVSTSLPFSGTILGYRREVIGYGANMTSGLSPNYAMQGTAVVALRTQTGGVIVPNLPSAVTQGQATNPIEGKCPEQFVQDSTTLLFAGTTIGSWGTADDQDRDCYVLLTLRIRNGK